MKKVILLFACIFSFTLSAQSTSQKALDKTSDGISTVYGDGKKVAEIVYSDFKKFSPKMEAAVNEIAKGLKVGTTKVWDILVKQQRVWAWCYLMIMIVGVASWVHFYFRFERMRKTYTDNGFIPNHDTLINILSFCMALTLSIISGYHFAAMMTGFMNPEYSAMMTIIEVSKGF